VYHHIVLIGLSGSGKSTIGPRLARALGRPFLDTDAMIVNAAGRSIPEIFATEGEVGFRSWEREAVQRALDGPPAVIATGGGAPVDQRNRVALWEGNLVVWLDAPVKTLAARLGKAGAGRPLLADGGPEVRLRALRAQREAVYATSHVRLNTQTLAPKQAVRALMDIIEREIS
jgi:shikimate kinase